MDVSELERHRFEFEGATGLLAQHLVEDHGLRPDAVAPHDGGLTQGHWVALDDLHCATHEEEQKSMTRPTADDAYARAKSALDDAERAAGGREGMSAVEVHLAVAEGWRRLAESLVANTRRPHVSPPRRSQNAGA